MYIFHVRHNNNTIKYAIVSANTFKSFWLPVSAALRPSSANIYRLSAFNVSTIWDPVVCTIVHVHVAKTFQMY